MRTMTLLVLVLVLVLVGCEEGYTYNPDEPEPSVGLESSCSALPCEEELSCYVFGPLNKGGPERRICHASCDVDAPPGSDEFCGGCTAPTEDEMDGRSWREGRGLCRARVVPLGGACRWSDDCDDRSECWDGICSYGPPPED